MGDDGLSTTLRKVVALNVAGESIQILNGGEFAAPLRHHV